MHPDLNAMTVPLNAHAKPPSSLRDVYKEYHKLKPESLEKYAGLIQFDGSSSSSSSDIRPTQLMRLPAELRRTLGDFLGNVDVEIQDVDFNGQAVCEVPDVPGKIGHSLFNTCYYHRV